MRRVPHLLCVLALGLAFAGCRADATISIEVDAETGAGVVSVAVVLDEEAAVQLGGADALRLDDLTAAGWSVVQPIEAAGGLALGAEKAFANPAEFSAVMSELAGPAGPLRNFTYTRDRTFGRTTYRISGEVDLSGGLDAFGDDELAAILGSPIGWDITTLEAELGLPLADSFTLAIDVRLPGSLSAPGADIDSGRARWVPRLDDPALEINAVGRADDQEPTIWAAIAIGAVGLLALVLAVRALGVLRRRSEIVVPSRAPTVAVASRAVVLGWYGVVVEPSEPLSSVLGPFCRERGSRLSAPDISARYRDATLGRLSATEFWAAVEVQDDARQLNRDYLSRFALVTGLLDAVARASSAGWVVAASGNDIASWNRMLRRRFGLDEALGAVVVSGDVGRRFPDRAMFEALRRETGAAFVDMVLVDRNLNVLDAAAELGIRTILYWPDGHVVPGDHELLRNLADLPAQL